MREACPFQSQGFPGACHPAAIPFASLALSSAMSCSRLSRNTSSCLRVAGERIGLSRRATTARCAWARSLSLLLIKHPEGFGFRCSIGFAVGLSL
jgi:hypothetical protein